MISNESNVSKSYYTKTQLDLDSWFKITSVDYEELINNNFFLETINSLDNEPAQLLDIGCGTGFFPSRLDTKIKAGIKLSADLLDPSAYCLEKCRESFSNLNHFNPNQAFESCVEDINKIIPKDKSYDIIWAIHSLYTVDIKEIKNILQKLVSLLKPGGTMLLYQASTEACYHKFYEFYRKKFIEAQELSRFLTAEDLEVALESMSLNYDSIDFNFYHRVKYGDQDILESYLHKCVLNNSVDVLKLFNEHMLKNFRSEENQYQFKQVVKLIVVKNECP